jgi:hypothetical protein
MMGVRLYTVYNKHMTDINTTPIADENDATTPIAEPMNPIDPALVPVEEPVIAVPDAVQEIPAVGEHQVTEAPVAEEVPQAGDENSTPAAL